MAKLLLGPMVRYVSDTEATIWVETDCPCEVKILEGSAPTFGIADHHYALVCLTGLEPGELYEYEVHLDGERAWPEEGSEFPPSVISTLDPDGKTDLVFASCRVALPHEEPYILRKDEDERGREVDALYVLAKQMLENDRSDFPEAILMLGDQIYADEVSPKVHDFIEERRGDSSGEDDAPLDEVRDYEEYTRLYWEAWSEPVIRWLLSTVSTSMIFDDHDVHDDWNISRSWVADMRRKAWWHDRITGAFMSYWIYQHIGNLSPGELAKDETFQDVTSAAGSDRLATKLLREFAVRADREEAGTRWTFYRDIGKTRVIMMDSRGGRCLTPDRRSIFDDVEWDWIVEHATGDFDHLVIGSSLPFLLGQGMHYFEAWNEAVCDGAWGRLAARGGEWVRRELDLEHWAAFSKSFDRLATLLEEVGSGERGKPPASIVMLGGDVHHAYLAEVAFPRSAGVESAIYQATCSPMRNPLNDSERRFIKAGVSRPVHAIGRALARSAGVEDPPIRWRFSEGPWFNNQVATLKIDGREACMRLDKTNPPTGGKFELERVFDHALTPDWSDDDSA
ncbi:MAG: alkaline phosphatase D family protein [Solirubrobacterales bacterium]